MPPRLFFPPVRCSALAISELQDLLKAPYSRKFARYRHEIRYT